MEEDGYVDQCILRDGIVKHIGAGADVVVVDGCGGSAEGLSGRSHGQESAVGAHMGVGGLAGERRASEYEFADFGSYAIASNDYRRSVHISFIGRH